MQTAKLAGLNPASVFSYFEQICAIPHGSGNTKPISDYLVAFAKEQGLRYIQDADNNVIIFKPGTLGLENRPAVIIQGHMDMVCEKDADCPIDMDSQGLDITHDGNYIFANGTTLGADNGIAVAMSLALLASSDIPHPPLEVLVTVDEEIGMLGAASVDTSEMQGRILLNLDSAHEGVFTAGCAGGATAVISMPAQKRPVYGPCIRLVVEGLQGGHSGAEIHQNRANANKVMGELLSRIQKVMSLSITSLAGGAKDNAIPRACQVTAVMLGMNVEPINTIIETLQQEIRSQYDEPEAVIRGENIDALGGNALSSEQSAKLISLLCALPNGVQKMSEEITGLVQTSLNLGIAKLDETLNLTISVRSGINKEKQELLDKLAEIAAFHDASFSQMGAYPAWEFKKESHLRDVMVSTYRKMYEKEPQVVAIHAGLECGLLSEKIPGLDCISLGPEMHDIHTSREKLGIASTERIWQFLLEVLKQL